MKIHIGAMLCLIFVLQSQLSEGQEQSPPLKARDLAGKWEGTPPLGGSLVMEITVKDGKIEGDGRINTGTGHAAARPEISGTVNGSKVYLETYFPRQQGTVTVKYNCNWVELDKLDCKTPRHETEFKRVK